MKIDLYFRVDGNAEIGFGHVYRCIALAEMLAGAFNILFCSIGLNSQLQELIQQKQFQCKSIQDNTAFLKLLTGRELVVIDNYYFDLAFQDKIKSTGVVLIAIDDIQDREFNVDLIINHAPGIDVSRYRAPAFTQYALGLDFVLLREQFLKAASTFKNKADLQSVCICFGGSDPKNLTEKTLKTLIKRPFFTKIHVITGPGYQRKQALIEQVKNDDRIIHHNNINADQMIAIMSSCGSAIVPTSGIFLEAMALNCSLIAGWYVENQRHLFERFKQADYFVSAEDFSEENLTDALDRFVKGGQKYQSPIDGKSGARLLKIFKNLELGHSLSLRRATTADSDTTYAWATNKTVRKYAFSQETITYESHCNWFARKINDANCLYYILENKEKALGSIRFDLTTAGAVISYLIDPNFHGQGLGLVLMRKGVEQLMVEKAETKTIIGDVMPENIASQRALEKLGFAKTITAEQHLRYIKNLD